ncbi:MAG TPA: hypothetical protein V6D05_18760 [Stenomitos sp.]
MNLWIEGAQEAIPLPDTPADRLELARRVVPFFPWIPLVPAALLLGTSLTALALALRASRRVQELAPVPEPASSHERLHQQPLETFGP